MYRFNEKVTRLIETSMNNWNTTMKLHYNDGCIITDPIKIKRSIFQGDIFIFTPIHFVHGPFVPLKSDLAATGYGCKITNTNARVSNLFPKVGAVYINGGINPFVYSYQ